MITIIENEKTEVTLFIPQSGTECLITAACCAVFCCHCNRQSPNFYTLEQSEREFSAGKVLCSFCSAEIKIVLPGYNANFIHQETYFDGNPVAVYKINLPEMYRLNSKVWQFLPADFWKKNKGKSIKLSQLIKKIQLKHPIQLDASRQYYFEDLKLPAIVNRWYSLLNDLQKEPKKTDEMT